MAEIQPPNTQTLRPQHLSQVGHEGNPVLTCGLDASGVLDSPNFFSCVPGDAPILYPVTGTGGAGASDEPLIPLVASAGSMNCAGSQTVTVTVTGGIAPYTFEASVGVITPSGGHTAILTPPVNANPTYEPNVAAFGRVDKYVFSCAGGGPCACKGEYYNCAGTLISTCTSSTTNECILKCGATWHCSGFVSTTTPDPIFRLNGVNCFTYLTVADACDIDNHTICSCDLRDVFMQGNGCEPCDVSFHSSVVTVTDALGHNAYVVVERDVNVG